MPFTEESLFMVREEKIESSDDSRSKARVSDEEFNARSAFVVRSRALAQARFLSNLLESLPDVLVEKIARYLSPCATEKIVSMYDMMKEIDQARRKAN